MLGDYLLYLTFNHSIELIFSKKNIAESLSFFLLKKGELIYLYDSFLKLNFIKYLFFNLKVPKMNYIVIKGKFRVIGYSPDGDSLKFEANKIFNWNKIITVHHELFASKLKEKNGVVQLRLQGIDALETHYPVSSLKTPKEVVKKKPEIAKSHMVKKMVSINQPKEFGDMATDILMNILGLENVVKSTYSIKSFEITKGKKTKTYSTKDADPIEGYIIVNDVERKGRPISFAFAGKTRLRDGAKITKDKLKTILKESINYQLLEEGVVYPYFFFTLSAKLRSVLSEGVKVAQDKEINIWSKDKTKTATGVNFRRFSQLSEEHIIFPYLFRRLAKHRNLRLFQGYWKALEEGKAYKPKLESLFLKSFFDDTNPYVFLVDEKDFRRLDEIVIISRNKLKLITHPRNIVFLS